MLHKYHVIYSVQYYLWFHVTVVGLGTITDGYGGTTVILVSLHSHLEGVTQTMNLHLLAIYASLKISLLSAFRNTDSSEM
jgi:hypothetical protein